MRGERVAGLEDPFRRYRCRTVISSATVCPRRLNPARTIAEAKKLLDERAV